MAPSRFAPLTIPESNLWDFLFERSSKPFADDQVLFRHPESDRHYDFSSLRSTAQQFSTGLVEFFGFRKGDVLALFTSNSIDVPAITFGTLELGGIISPANPAYTARELAHHLRDSSAKILVTTKALLGVALGAATEVGLSRENILIIGLDEDIASGSYSAAARNWRTVLSSSSPTFSVPQVLAQDLAFLVYSSGTTGMPKGVELTHKNIIANCCMVAWAEGEDKRDKKDGLKSGRDKILSVLPQYHIYGLQCLIHVPIYLGVEVLVPHSFDVGSFCSIVQRHRITYAYVAPPIVLHLAHNPVVELYDLTSLRFLTSGAAPLARRLIEIVHGRWNIPVKQAYGLSETSPVTHIQLWDDSWTKNMGSVGPTMPNLATKFVTPEGVGSVTGAEGELWIKGPTVFRGYHRNAQETEECKTVDVDGEWFKTGDIGYEDANGNLVITDRVKELIKYKGSQVAPAELEEILLAYPGIQDVAVLGRWVEEIHTEVPVAFIVLKSGWGDRDEAQAQEVVQWIASHAAKTKWLRGGVVYVDEVPKSGSGKILRRILKEQLKTKDIKFWAEKLYVGETKL